MTGYGLKMIKIHAVVVEPHIPKGEDLYLMLCTCEIDGVISYEDIWSDRLDWSYNIVKHCSSKIEPYELVVN
jgi:hypothetical protein